MSLAPKKQQSAPNRRRIFDAASAEVAKRGYRRTTIEGIAKRAGAGKQTIYRWWKNKAALFLDVYLDLIDLPAGMVTAGSVEDQLTARLSKVFRIYRQSQAGKILCGLLSDAQDDIEAAAILSEGLVLGRRFFLVDPIRQAVDTGRLPPETDIDRIYDTIVARVWHALLTDPSRLSDPFALSLVAETLAAPTGIARLATEEAGSAELKRGYRPGLVGEIAALHGTYYAQEWGFDHRFEALVATEVSAFINTYDPERDLVLSIDSPDGALVASISIMAGAETNRAATAEARIRWFIVDPSAVGFGYGRALLNAALSFCDECHVPVVKLTTFEGLDAARHLYDEAGFHLVSTIAADQWNMGVCEVLLERTLPA